MPSTAVTKYSKDLSAVPPRSPRERLRGYAIMARMIDKGRATLNDTAGAYHFDCPVDNELFRFKGIHGDDVRELLASGASDEEVAAWIEERGLPRSTSEVLAWSDAMEADRPYDNPEKRAWFIDECARLGLDPKGTTLFDYLEFDDRLSFQR